MELSKNELEQKVLVQNLKPLRFDNNITMGCDPEFFFVDVYSSL